MDSDTVVSAHEAIEARHHKVEKSTKKPKTSGKAKWTKACDHEQSGSLFFAHTMPFWQKFGH